VNPYYDKFKEVIVASLDAFDDGKVSMSEVWVFIMAVGNAVQLVAMKDLTDEDLRLMKDAGARLYDEHVVPLDLPGPDWVADPLLRNSILPGAIEGAFNLAKKGLGNLFGKGKDDEEGGESKDLQFDL